MAWKVHEQRRSDISEPGVKELSEDGETLLLFFWGTNNASSELPNSQIFLYVCSMTEFTSGTDAIRNAAVAPALLLRVLLSDVVDAGCGSGGSAGRLAFRPFSTPPVLLLFMKLELTKLALLLLLVMLLLK